MTSQRPFDAVREFHRVMDGEVQVEPRCYETEEAGHRSDFKIEEIVEFIQATVSSDHELDEAVAHLHQVLDKAHAKVKKKGLPADRMVAQVDALVDLLYLTYGSFVLMGIDPEEIFSIVHRANIGKIFPDGKAHYDPVTHKILKPENWEVDYAPEPFLKAEIERQIQEAKRAE